MDRFGGRKFLALLVMLALGTGAELYATHGLSTNYVYLLLGLYTAFTAGNVGITLKSLKAAETVEQAEVPVEAPGDDSPPPMPGTDLGPVLESLTRIETGVSHVVQTVPNQIQALQFLTAAEQQRQQLRQQMMAIRDGN